MSQPGLLGPLDSTPPNSLREWGGESPPIMQRSLPRLWWLSLLLLFFTLVTTTIFGASLASSFEIGRPFNQQDLINGFFRALRADPTLLKGLMFSIPLLLILMAHEMGHYVACRKCGVAATLPYFLPSPTLFGTFGAFIRIKTPIYTRRDLFDIGSAGPLAGFVMLLPFLLFGIGASHRLPPPGDEQAIIIGNPLALHAVEWVRFGVSGSGDVLLHPVAMAALAGMLMTALNLLPVGQLDGGHVVYAIFGERGHKIISTCMVALLLVMGKFYWPWWFWAVVAFFLGRRHPLVYDGNPPGVTRRWLAAATFVVFLLCASLVPTRI